MNKTVFGAAATAVLLCMALPALANPIVVGTPVPGSGDCAPFGCAFNGEYQQVYDHGQFSGPITITGLEFFNTAYNSYATAMNSGTWTFALSTTAADWNTLSSTLASNIGSDNTTVFSSNLYQPWAFGDTLTIVFSTPFVYDPANGNLLVDVVASGVTDNAGAIFFDFNQADNGVFGRAHTGTIFGGESFSGVEYPYGLVTGFLNGPLSVPEPGSLGLFGAGLGLLALGGLFARMKRRQPGLA